MTKVDAIDFLINSIKQYKKASAKIDITRNKKRYTLHINFSFDLSLGQTARLSSLFASFLPPVSLNEIEEEKGS